MRSKSGHDPAGRLAAPARQAAGILRSGLRPTLTGRILPEHPRERPHHAGSHHERHPRLGDPARLRRGLRPHRPLAQRVLADRRRLQVDVRRRAAGHDQEPRREPQRGHGPDARARPGQGRQRRDRHALRHLRDGRRLDRAVRLRHRRRRHPGRRGRQADGGLARLRQPQAARRPPPTRCRPSASRRVSPTAGPAQPAYQQPQPGYQQPGYQQQQGYQPQPGYGQQSRATGRDTRSSRATPTTEPAATRSSCATSGHGPRRAGVHPRVQRRHRAASAGI